MHLGTCVGKMTHSGKFRLTIGCLDLLASQAKYKVANPRALPSEEALLLYPLEQQYTPTETI